MGFLRSEYIICLIFDLIMHRRNFDALLMLLVVAVAAIYTLSMLLKAILNLHVLSHVELVVV